MSDDSQGAALRKRLARHRHVLMGLGALLCAAIAVHAGRRYLDERLEAERTRLTPAPVVMESVVVARRDLSKGDLISAESMAVRAIPRPYAIASAIRPDQFDSYQGARLAVGLRAGEPLLDSAIIGVDQAVFSQRLRQGIRALTISVDEVNAISGLLQPGDRVDLFFSARPPAVRGGSSNEATLPLLQNILVLATGRQVRPLTDQQAGNRGYGTITVELGPLQAQQVVVAQRAGRITAVLRHPDDRHQEAASRMDLRQLFGQVEAVRVVRRGPQMIIGGMGRQWAGAGASAAGGSAPAPVATATSWLSAGSAPGTVARPGAQPVAGPAGTGAATGAGTGFGPGPDPGPGTIDSGGGQAAEKP